MQSGGMACGGESGELGWGGVGWDGAQPNKPIEIDAKKTPAH